jgi:hypothetical protein
MPSPVPSIKTAVGIDPIALLTRVLVAATNYSFAHCLCNCCLMLPKYPGAADLLPFVIGISRLVGQNGHPATFQTATELRR